MNKLDNVTFKPTNVYWTISLCSVIPILHPVNEVDGLIYGSGLVFITQVTKLPVDMEHSY